MISKPLSFDTQCIGLTQPSNSTHFSVTQIYEWKDERDIGYMTAEIDGATV